MVQKRTVNLKLKAAIVESGKSLSDVAIALGTSKAVLSRKINGLYWFNEYEIQAISIILNKPITDIFFGQEVTKLITDSKVV